MLCWSGAGTVCCAWAAQAGRIVARYAKHALARWSKLTALDIFCFIPGIYIYSLAVFLRSTLFFFVNRTCACFADLTR